MKQTEALNRLKTLLQKCDRQSYSSSILIVAPDTPTFTTLIKLREFLPEALKKNSIQKITVAINGTNKRASFPVHGKPDSLIVSPDYSNN